MFSPICYQIISHENVLLQDKSPDFDFWQDRHGFFVIIWMVRTTVQSLDSVEGILEERRIVTTELRHIPGFVRCFVSLL